MCVCVLIPNSKQRHFQTLNVCFLFLRQNIGLHTRVSFCACKYFPTVQTCLCNVPRQSDSCTPTSGARHLIGVHNWVPGKPICCGTYKQTRLRSDDSVAKQTFDSGSKLQACSNNLRLSPSSCQEQHYSRSCSLVNAPLKNHQLTLPLASHIPLLTLSS